MKEVVKYYRSVKEELSKVIFPVKEQVRTAFFSVIIVVSVVAVFLAIVDLILYSVVSGIIS